MTGFEALQKSAAWIDLSARGRIRATGEDRKRLLHALTTNHVQQMEPGQTLYAFFLNSQGRILADVHIYCAGDHLLLDVEPEVREKVFTHLDRYIIADDVTLEDATDETAEIAVGGPQAPAPPPGAVTFPDTLTGAPGYRIVVPAAEKAAVLERLQQAGCVEASVDEARRLRIENGLPRYGEDITESNLAQETGMSQALHFNKGCYLGQEIVERVRSRGHVNKSLHALRIETAAAPAPGTKVLSAGKEAGEITSAVHSAAQGAVRALAYLRATTELTVDGAPAQIVQHA